MRTPRHPFTPFLFAALALPGIAGSAGSTLEQAAFAPSLEVADVPTAQTMYARMFGLNTRLFRGGGIVMKATASFNNSLQLGVAFKANNLIGSGNITFSDDTEEVVAALAKLKVLSMPSLGLNAAIGYDGMGYDMTRRHGIHGVVSKDISAGPLMFRIHGGAGAVRFRDAQADRDVNGFCGLSGALSEDLHLGIEWDDVFFHDGSANAMIGYAWDVGLRLELDFKNLFRGNRAYHRVFKIIYTF